MKIKLLLLLIVTCTCISVRAQEQLSLQNLDDFEDQAGNWILVEDVVMDRNIDIHQQSENPTKTKSKRKKRRKNIPEPLKPVIFTPGTGILININDGDKKDALVTKWEHGDVKLELDVMIPKGSNSGIYLQGRYEVQLFDSWGVKNPKYSDIGGIYRNWEEGPGNIFRGVSPSTNAAKAPGLWQNLKIHFQAPRFNTSGQKIANAKFVSVELNGVRIHTNVEVPLPTGGPISKQETANGPLVIQGNHGSVAFRNIQYQLLKESTIEMSLLTFKTYKGAFKGLEELEKETVATEGNSKQIQET